MMENLTSVKPVCGTAEILMFTCPRECEREYREKNAANPAATTTCLCASQSKQRKEKGGVE